MDSIKQFFGYQVEVAKRHPVMFGLSLLFIPIVLGGIAWKAVSLLRKVPVVGDAAAGALDKAGQATGSK